MTLLIVHVVYLWIYFPSVGNGKDSSSENILHKNNIQCILNVTTNVPFLDEARFCCQRLPASDSNSQELRPLFPTAFQFIGESVNSVGLKQSMIIPVRSVHRWIPTCVVRILSLLA